jgi:hypothetical protein
VLLGPVTFRTMANQKLVFPVMIRKPHRGRMDHESKCSLFTIKEVEFWRQCRGMSWLITLIRRVSSCWVPSTRLTIPRVSPVLHSVRAWLMIGYSVCACRRASSPLNSQAVQGYSLPVSWARSCVKRDRESFVCVSDVWITEIPIGE